MKLLIVLGLIPLFSAQQMGFLPSMMGFRQAQGKAPAQGSTQKKYNNNNMWGFNFNNNNMWGKSSGGKTSYTNNNQNKNNENLPGLDGVNAALIGQMRFMTDALESTLQKAAQDPNNAQAIDGVFEVMNNICVGSIDETIQLLNLGTNAAEMALLDSTDLLDDAIEGKVKIKAGKEGVAAAKAAADEAFSKLASKSGYKQKY